MAALESVYQFEELPLAVRLNSHVDHLGTSTASAAEQTSKIAQRRTPLDALRTNRDRIIAFFLENRPGVSG
jgi:hypothetical protein